MRNELRLWSTVLLENVTVLQTRSLETFNKPRLHYQNNSHTNLWEKIVCLSMWKDLNKLLIVIYFVTYTMMWYIWRLKTFWTLWYKQQHCILISPADLFSFIFIWTDPSYNGKCLIWMCEWKSKETSKDVLSFL